MHDGESDNALPDDNIEACREEFLSLQRVHDIR